MKIHLFDQKNKKKATSKVANLLTINVKEFIFETFVLNTFCIQSGIETDDLQRD